MVVASIVERKCLLAWIDESSVGDFDVDGVDFEVSSLLLLLA